MAIEINKEQIKIINVMMELRVTDYIFVSLILVFTTSLIWFGDQF
jgi:hypothetical protein